MRSVLVLVTLCVGVWSMKLEHETQLSLPFPKSNAARIKDIEVEQGEMKLVLHDVVNTVETIKNKTQMDGNAIKEKLDNEPVDNKESQLRNLANTTESFAKSLWTLNTTLGSRLDALEQKNLYESRYVTGDRCPIGFVKLGKQCYWFSTLKMNYFDAKSVCQNYGSYLAQIKDKEENDVIRGYARNNKSGSNYFLGATNIMQEGRWTWDGDNTDMNYTNWNPGQPNNYDKRQRCLALTKSEGNYMWNDIDCTTSDYFLCQLQ